MLKRHDQRLEATPTSPRTTPWFRLSALCFSLIIAGFLTAESISLRAHPWLGWFALIPVFISIRACVPWFAGVCGALWGASICTYTVFVDGPDQVSSWLGVALLTLVPALYSFIGAHATRRKGFDPLILGLGWAGAEFALQPLGLRHGLIAGIQGDSWLLLLVGQMGGYVLVAFLVAFVSAVLLSVVTDVVCVDVPRRRVLHAAGAQSFRVYVSDWFRFCSRFVSPSQPRAPPILA